MVEANRAAAELALELYSDCVRWLLLVGGGYECQESEGTFMVAFSSPDVAIEWCLMVQQVLKDMSWPARYDLCRILQSMAAWHRLVSRYHLLCCLLISGDG